MAGGLAHEMKMEGLGGSVAEFGGGAADEVDESGGSGGRKVL